MKKQEGPLDPQKKIEPNVDYEQQPNSSNAGNPEDATSDQSNALSNDTSGATQFVNLNTKEVPQNPHEIPDSTNTTDVPKDQDKVPKEDLGPLAGGLPEDNYGTGKVSDPATTPGQMHGAEPVEGKNPEDTKSGEESGQV